MNQTRSLMRGPMDHVGLWIVTNIKNSVLLKMTPMINWHPVTAQQATLQRIKSK